MTAGDVHYVREGDLLVPAGRTEFARDATFGYRSSNLREWVEEKTGGRYPAAQVVSIPLELLRRRDVRAVADILASVAGFNKVIVNAVDYTDLRVFLVGLAEALARGKRFLFRTAASFVQVLGGITPRPLLTGADLYPAGNGRAPGLVIAGSHVRKTTAQLESLRALPNLAWVEYVVARAESETGAAAESRRVTEEVDEAFRRGQDVCVYTSRKYYRYDRQAAMSEQNLVFSTRVSQGLVLVVQGLRARPGFLVAKGGITSSDIGVKGLGVKRAMVLGQIQPGVPVWELGPESRFPGLPYVIFPGNVGEADTLRTVVEISARVGHAACLIE